MEANHRKLWYILTRDYNCYSNWTVAHKNPSKIIVIVALVVRDEKCPLNPVYFSVEK